MAKAKDQERLEKAKRELFCREGNIFRLKERRENLWVWDVGIRAREDDRDWKIAGASPPHTLEAMEPGHLYWLFRLEQPSDKLLMAVITIAETEGRPTATTTELYQELEAKIEALSGDGFSTTDKRGMGRPVRQEGPGFRGPESGGPGRLFHRVQGSIVLVAVHAEGANVIKNRAGKKISPQIYWELAQYYTKPTLNLSIFCA